MISIAILSPNIVDGDAVSNDALGMYNILKQEGYNVEIFSPSWNVRDLSLKIRPLKEISSFLAMPTDILIYHFSMGWQQGIEIVKQANCIKIIKYHNVTPELFFSNINNDYFHACKFGREQIREISTLKDCIFISDSQYNAEELLLAGAPSDRSFVVSPFHKIDDLNYVEAKASILEKYLDGFFNILMVGRLAPNKGHLALIKVFEIYNKVYNPSSRLLIVGKEDERLSSYNRAVRGTIVDYQVHDSVVITGGTSFQELKAYYLVAHTFMTTSHHEGFCVPLIEAMSMKIPIVAYGSSAIPGTVGDSGIVWEDLDPYLLAGSLHCIASQPHTQRALGNLGWQRYQKLFTNETIAHNFLEIIRNL